MSLRNGKWTSFPNDDQIRREANREYWKFICPICGNGAGGRMHPSKMNPHEFMVTEVSCTCGWKWYDPIHYTPEEIQTTLDDFLMEEFR